MKKPTIFKVFIAAVFLLLGISSYGQLRKNFDPRYNTSLKGDILVIGNNILNRDGGGRNNRPNNAFDSQGTGTTANDNLDMKYIDIDNDAATFNSSSATLVIPDASKDCYEIAYAALYWSGTYQGSDRNNINKVKLKTGTSAYKDITGSIIWDEGASGVNNAYLSKPYACFKEITAEVKAAGPGLYTIADLVCSQGSLNPGGGNSAGWSIYVIYKDPKLPSKYITSFDGFSMIRSTDPPLDIPISGFTTNPEGNVNVKLGFSALEGDNPLEGDGLQFKGGKSTLWGDVSSLARPITPAVPPSRGNAGTPAKPNFFNSTITDGDAIMTNRNPASKNTLGYDAGVVKVLNDGNNIIQNNETSATLRINTSQDSYFMFFTAISVEIIEPKIVLTKIVKNSNGDNIGGQTVTLGQQLNYEIGFKNTGNDDATSFTIRDQLPINIIFNYPTDLLPLPDGVTVKSWNPATRSIVFDVRSDIVKVGLTEKTIKFKVQVIPDCTMLDEACSNSIDNSAYATYKGSQNTSFTISDDPSVDTNTGCILVPKATNFLVGVEGCQYDRKRTLCTETLDITAANGYSTYTWYSDKEKTKKIGTGQTLTVKDPGTYYVYNEAPAPCRSIFEKFTVERFGQTAKNPVLDVADQIVICPNDGKELPKIFLCGANASRLIKTGINDSSNIVWERLDTSSCKAVTNENCANESTDCKWIQVSTGPDFTAKDAGQYRLTINYSGSCFNRFYFNVFTNPLAPTEEHVDLLCGSNGSITVRDVPAGYQYAIKTSPTATIQDWEWQDSNTFPIYNPDSYTIYIRQKGVTTNPCIFKIPNILIRRLNLTLDGKKTDPICPTDLGSASVGIKNFEGPYYIYLYNQATGQIEKQDGPVTALDYSFSSLSYGTYGKNYYIRVTSSPIDQTPAPKCDVSYYFEIKAPSSQLKAFATLQEPFTACSDGKLLLSASGGKAPYAYFINGSPTRVDTNPVIITEAKTYEIRVVDDAGCSATTSITIPEVSKPTFDVNHTSSVCYDGASSIRIENIVANGNTLAYSITNGQSFSANPVFLNVGPGTYKVVVRYSVTYTVNNVQQRKDCFTDPIDVTITGPTSALTASAGVAALAGCSLPDGNGVNQGGKVRINNVEGGTPPYQYDFGDGKGWIPNKNEADVLPGTYVLRVKDNAGCIFTIPYDVVLGPKPGDPTIDDPITTYTCDGKASTTVTVRNPQNANYTYEYYIDNVPNTPITNNVFTNVKAGTHTIKVKYKVTSVPTYSNLLREDFGRGPDAKIPGIHPAYCWEPQDDVEDCGVGGYMPILLNDGEYVVTKGLLPAHVGGFNWNLPKDNTAVINNTPGITDGRFLAVNVGGVVPIGGVLYSKTINDVIPNQDIQVSLYMLNLLSKNNNLPSPRLTIQLQKNGQVITGASKDTQEIPRDEKWHNTTDLGNGQVLTLNPGNNTSLEFVILSYSQVIDGNDLAVDDIWVRQIPETCGAEKDFTVIVEDSKGFKADTPIVDNLTCIDKADGIITIPVSNFNPATGYYYTVNGGGLQNSSASPLVLDKLAAGNYTVVVQYDTAGNCSTSYSRSVTAPEAVTALATVTTQPTCIDGAVIKASAKGGKPNYKYQLERPDGTIVIAFQTEDTFNLPVTTTGDFVVVVKDSGDCSSAASDKVTVVGAVPPTATLDPSSDLCYDAGNKATLVVSVSGGKAPYHYSLDGVNYQDSEKFENLGSGNYTIYVRDANGCNATPLTNIAIGTQVTAYAEVTKALDCTNSPNAQITITAQNGTPGYTYEVSVNGAPFAAIGSNVYPASATGSYVFRVTDSKGCPALTTAVTVDAKLTPTGSTTPINPKCYNGNNGSFTVIPAGGNGGPYEFSFDGGNFTTSATHSNLNAFVGATNTKTYKYQVKDGKGCLSPIYDVILTNPTEVKVSGSFPANTTCSSTAVITIIGAGGAGNYTYNFDGGTNYNGVTTKTVTLTNAEQTIKFYVKDGNGCTAEGEVKVPAFNPPTGITISNPAAITCNAGSTTTSLTLTANGGIAPYTYEVTAGPVTPAAQTGNTATFTGLTAGYYEFKVTDARGCTATGSKTIADGVKIKAEGSKTDELCVGSKNGSATFTVSDVSSTGNFTYTFTPNTGTPNVNGNKVTYTNLAPGTYTFVATDRATGCISDSKQVTVGAATPITFDVAASKISCNNKFTTITISNLQGGTGNYSYAFAASGSTAPSTPYGTTLTVDTSVLTTSIDVYVKDANNCAVKKTVSVGTEDPPRMDPIAAQCYPGSPISVKITGAYALPATFSKDGTNFGTADTFNLTPGTYKLTVKDKFGCTDFINYIVPEQLTITPKVEEDITCTANTTITLTSAGGTGTRTYAVSFNGGAYSTVTSPYTATAAGTYKFRVNDTANPVCYAYTTDIPVTLKPTTLTISTSKVDVLCNGASTGSILVTPTSGKAPYTYSITKTTAPFTNYTVNNPSGLSAGTYTIVVTDAIGCTSPATASVTINENTKVTASAVVDPFTCNTSNVKESKDVTVTAGGGVGPYTYSFNGGSFETSNKFEVKDNQAPQTVKFTVKDSKGCLSDEGTISITPLSLPEIDKVDVTPIYCDPVASRTSTATITLSKGSGTYTIVSGPTTNTTGATNGVFTGLTAGDYVFRVTNANGCYDDFSKNIPALVSIKATATKQNDVYCFNGNTGSIKYDLSNFTSYSYTVNGIATGANKTDASFVLSNLAEGNYVVVFTDDTTLCTISTTVRINQPTAKVSAVVAQVNANCKTATSKVTVTASGGTPDYKYAYMQNNVVPADGDYILLASADLDPTVNTQWDVWVKDANGCTEKVDVTITTDPVPSVSAVVANQCTASGSNFQIVATALSGVAPYTYTINTGVTPSPANTFTVPAGTYTITVKDANGCPATTVVTVNDPLTAEAVLDKDITCALPAEAKIDIEIFGGKAPFGYRVKIGAGAYSGTPNPITGNTFSYYPTSLIGNTYEFEITDSNGVPCTTITKVITTNTPATVTASAVKVDPTCNGFDDGSVEITATAGVSPFQYNFNGLGFGTKSVFGGLIAGTYSYQVRDAKGCVSTPQDITLVDPAKIVALVTPTIIECNDNKPGSITVDITSGGVAPFTYTIYNNTFTQVVPPVVTSATSVTFGGDPLDPAVLTYGDYYITVVDSKGCEFKSAKTRIETRPYIEATGIASSGTCAAGASVTINVLTAAYPVTYSIFGQPATAVGPTMATSNTFNGLDHGTTYQFQVIDNGGCFTIVEVTTPPSPSSIALDPIVKEDVLCFGNASGKIDFTVRNYGALVSEIRYEVRDELTNVLVPGFSGAFTGLTGAPAFGTITGLKAGNYTLYLKEFDGTECNVSQKFQITQPVQGLTSSVLSNKPATCDKPAQVTLTTTGGTGPYTYSYAVAPATSTTFASGNVLNLDPGAAGTDLVWNITVKDANGCTFPLQVTITKDPSPVIALSVVNKCAAQDAFTVRVSEVTPGKGAYSISVDSNNAYTSITGGLPYDVTGLHSGSHTIYIKDANGCIDSKTILIDAPIKVVPELGTLPDCGVSNGSITLTPSGGSGAYTYTISPTYPSVVIAGNTISGLPDGTYTVTMTDNNNNDNTGVACITSAQITLPKGIDVTFDAQVVNVACKGDATGSIKVNLLAGNTDTPYTYQIALQSGAPLPSGIVQTDNVFSNLPAETYIITVTSGRKCSLALPYTVSEPTNPLTASPSVTQYACSGGSDTPEAAIITINALGGAGGYKYNFDGGTDYYDSNVLLVSDDKSTTPRTFNYYVIDKNGCKTNGTATVDPFVKLSDIDFAVTVAPTCPLNVATITLTAIDGNTPIAKYEMVSPTSIDNGPVAVFNNIQPGVNYIFRVTDSKNCSIERPYKLDPIAPIDIVKTSQINVSCNTINGTNNNGTATFTVSDFSASGYTVAVTSTPALLPFNPPTTAGNIVTVTGLVEGTYTITVTDNTTNCSKFADVIITMPAPIVFTASGTKVYCTNTDSQITVTSVVGGTSPYTYAVVPGGTATAPTAFPYAINAPATVSTGLTNLSWDVYVKDANGCIAGPENVVIIYNAAPVLNMPAQQCYVGTDLTVDLDALATTYNNVKSFTVDGVATSSPATFTKAGNYKIVLTDDNGCTAERDYIIEERLTAAATVEKDLYCEVGNEAAKIVVEVKGGVKNYTYQMYLDGVAVFPAPKTATGDFTEFVTAEGDYTFEISDSNVPCTFTTIPVTVTDPEPITLGDSHTDVLCWNDSNGTLTVVPTGGVEPYSYVLSGTVTNTTGDVSGVYTDLPEGTYTVQVTDGKGCTTTSANIIIIQPDELKATPEITPNNACNTFTEIVITATGGKGKYQYNFDGNGYDDTNSISVPNDGSVLSVTYTVRDANGCETPPVTVPIVPLNKPKALAFLATAITCNPANATSTVTVTATDGVGALKFKIIEFNGAATTLYPPVSTTGSADPAVFTGLPFGEYKFEVTDSFGCSFTDILTIKDVVKIQATGDAFAKSCIGTDDGKVVFTMSDFKGTYTYSVTKDGAAFVGPITTADTEVTLANLAKGDYEISVVDDITTCPTTFKVTVNDPIDVTVSEEGNVNANCKIGAVVTVLGHGGAGDYTYSFVVAGATYGAFEPEATRVLDPATPSWYVYAKDKNGCISQPITVNITTDPLPSNFTAKVTSHCADSNGNYEIVVDDSAAIGVGPFTYSIGGGFQISKSFTVNVAKAYDITVRDKFGCETKFPALVTILQPLELKTEILDWPSCKEGDGRISVTATGGSGNYSYSIDKQPAVTTTTAEFTGLDSGSHTIDVIDTTTKCPISTMVVIAPATKIIGFEAKATPVTCFSYTDGKIRASITPEVNDNPIYKYRINNGPLQESGLFEGLAAGDYRVEVFSGRGCTAFIDVEVKGPKAIVVPDPAVVQYLCTSGNTSNFATITVTGVTGGSENYDKYEYEFIKNGVRVYKGERNVYTQTDFTGGNFVVKVYDENGCEGTNPTTWVINPFIRLDKVNVRVDDAITCPTKENITVSVDATGGTPTNLEYSIAYSSGATVPGNAPNANGVFTDLGIGEYIITVLNKDTGCLLQKVHNVFDPNTFSIQAVAVNGEICFNATDGSVDLTFVDNQIVPKDDAGRFDYVVTGPSPSTAVVASGQSPTAGPQRVSNLSAGLYKVVATLVGDPRCSVETLFTISQPNEALVATSAKVDITCIAGNNDGEISVSATGGWNTSYQYELVKDGRVVENYSSKTNYPGLTAGVYTINVKDAKGCMASTSQTLIVPLPINATASANVTTLPCFGDKSGVVTVSPPTGGQGSNYMYTLNILSEDPVISSGPFSSPVFSGLGAGRYSVTITDGFSCEFTTNEVEIKDPLKVLATLVESRAQTCQTLTQLTLSAEGGTGPYTYSADGTTILGSFASSISFEVPVGSYKYFVFDSIGCRSVVSNTVTIYALTPLDIKLDVSSAVVKCTGEATGVITAEAVGGLGHYSYTLLNATDGIVRPAQDNGVFADLPIGTYRVAVESVDCNDRSELVVITEPREALQAQFKPTDVTCFGENNGKLEIIASGGTGVIKYAISPNLNQFDTKVLFEKLAPGDYQAIAQDENGCFVLYDFTISQPRPVVVTEVPNSMIPEVCDGDKDGAFSIEIKGGTLPYSVSLDAPNGPFTAGTATQTVFDFTNLKGGAHTVYVKDANNCPVDFVENMPNAVILNPTAEVTYDCVNNAQANMVVVTIDASITNPAEVDYSLDNNGTFQPSNIFTNVAPGSHFIVARHTNGCEVPTPIFEVAAVDPVSLIDVTNQSKDINTIVVKASGGVAPYEYSFNGESFSSSNSYRIYKSGDYVVIVRDKNGCEATITVQGTFYDFCLPNYFTPNGDGQNDTIGPDCGALAYKELTFDIYDRYGRVVAKYHVGEKWDGRYHGNELPTGDYWYVLKLNDPKDPREFVGHFTLYR
ncbi:T9SS type B sorting domain-containing protein [Flavobacterium tyrosinilyticum]|uniref:T9SS type B sorting domain-containing protein n=1 Tax=Flavobacterium tyrosinilyticum TaxID=1658740 RepID=UPI002030784D|nr:T9SS type B sorting domain-containing protein [Flavobacterium tyrosinilyticum]MCM0665490.1 T9SS type B sorting domain-containing protein [Flavobacterium tyrosinilyticum]